MGKIGIIIKREFNERVRKRSFILTTFLTPLLLIALIGAVAAITYYDLTGSSARQIMVYDKSGVVGSKLENSKQIIFSLTDSDFDQIKEEKAAGEHTDLFGVLVIGENIIKNPRDVTLYAYSSSGMELEMGIGSQLSKIIEDEKLKDYDIENLSQIMDEVKTSVSLQSFRIEQSGELKASASQLSTVMAYIFGFTIYMFVFMYGAMVMQGVIEEKRSKVLEIMVSSVTPFQLMMGKILGIALVAITQFLMWIVLVVVGAGIMMQFLSPDLVAAISSSSSDIAAIGGGAATEMSSIDPELALVISKLLNPAYIIELLVGFLLFFIGGYLLYAAMFAAIGSAVDNEADTQQLQIPLTIPMGLSIFVLMFVLRDPNSSMAFWFSMIPFTSPIIMMARLPYGIPLWEIILSLVILYGSFIVMVWLAGKIYRVGIFMYGKKPSLKEFVKWARYKY